MNPDNASLLPALPPDRTVCVQPLQAWDDSQPRVLDAWVDNLYFSFDIMIGPDVMEHLIAEQVVAREVRDERKAVYVSEWLNAGVSLTGAHGYTILIERKDQWAIRVQNTNPHQPGIFVEMRSYLLHLHPAGILAACEEACAFIRDHLLADDPTKASACVLHEARCSRLDLHLDWQGGWHPTLHEGEVRQFIKPARAGWEPKMEGDICTGYVFGKKNVMARIYNKSKQCDVKHITWYPAYLQQKAGAAYNPAQAVWRLEFKLKRDGMKGFYLETPPEITDEDDILDAEMEGEDLPNTNSRRR